MKNVKTLRRQLPPGNLINNSTTYDKTQRRLTRVRAVEIVAMPTNQRLAACDRLGDVATLGGKNGFPHLHESALKTILHWREFHSTNV